MSMKTILAATLALGVGTSLAFAQQDTAAGPVAKACKADMAKFCAGKSHQNRETRNCLEANKAKVTAACRTALNTTGGGQSKGKNK